jgi:hypothetical protein
MESFLHSIPRTSDLWSVLALFLIPIGGGIPAGVLLARDLSIFWPYTAFLYFVSDIILACVFEPLMLAAISAGQRSPRLARAGEAFRQATLKTTAVYGARPGAFALILIAIGVDPMTGRIAAKAAGHGFFTGWALAITGDMVFFGMIMASTLWLDGILNNGAWTTIIIFALMFGIPSLIRRWRERAAASKSGAGE